MKSVKAFFFGLISGFAFSLCVFISWIFRRKLQCDASSADRTGEYLSDAEKQASGAVEDNREARRINQDIAELADDGTKLIEEIRNQKLKK